MTLALDVIQPHETWNIFDPSKISTFQECARKYFYQHVLGWNSTLPNNHLTFGTAWHLAVEHLSRSSYTKESLEEAKFMFLTRYRMDFPPESDKDMKNKRPDIALQALEDYFSKFQRDVEIYEVLHTEIGGVALVSPTSEIHFKMDWIGRERKSGKILFIDQKTASTKYYDWGDRWIFTMQMLSYYHVLHCLFPRAEIAPSKIRCAFFYKSSPGAYSANPAQFDEFPFTKTTEQMQAWQVRANYWIQSIKCEMLILLNDEVVENEVMSSFQPNDKACFNYNRVCPYFSLCENWSNPLQNVHRMPYGMKVDNWDPRSHELIREKVNLVNVNR